MQDHAQASPPDRAPTSKVRSAVFYPLLACNARCPFCSTRVYTPEGVVATSDYLKGDTRRGIQAYTLSYEESRERYRGFRDQGVESVNLQGGEPTVWEPLIDLLAYGKELGFAEQIVVTNGRRLADRQFAERLYGSAATAIALSLFGATAALHDESMGVPGAFDDMREGVRNLVAIERERREGRQITAQLILHARNFETLPEMIDLWYGEGLRYFCVRLLRETPNTIGAEDQWLFDLALLKEPLERALDRTFALPDLEIVFPELPYCLPDARYTGFVLHDLVANQRLRVEKRVESRHSLSLLTGLRRDTVRAACDACQLGEVCVRVEVAHAPRFSGTLTPVDVPARIEALLAGPQEESDLAIGHVLAAADALLRFGVTEESLGALRARRVAFAEARDLPDLPLRIAGSP
ncbi:MAG: radical SAM protein, partial [Byssovorax sp.]